MGYNRTPANSSYVFLLLSSWHVVHYLLVQTTAGQHLWKVPQNITFTTYFVILYFIIPQTQPEIF